MLKNNSRTLVPVLLLPIILLMIVGNIMLFRFFRNQTFNEIQEEKISLESQIFRTSLREYQRISLLMQSVRGISADTEEDLQKKMMEILNVYGPAGEGSGIIEQGGYLNGKIPGEWYTTNKEGVWLPAAFPIQSPRYHDEGSSLEPGELMIFSMKNEESNEQILFIRYKPKEQNRFSVLFKFDWQYFEELYIRPVAEEILSGYELEWIRFSSISDEKRKRLFVPPEEQLTLREFDFAPLKALLNLPHKADIDHTMILPSPLMLRKPVIMNEQDSKEDAADLRRDFFSRLNKNDDRDLGTILILGHEEAPFYRDMEKHNAINWLQSTVILLGIGLIFLIMVAQYIKLKKLRDKEKEFVASMTHELRTPLTVIQSAADNLAGGIIPPEKTGRYGTLIKDQVLRLGTMVEEILQFSSMEGNIKPPDPVKIDLNKMIEDVRDAVTTPAEARGISLIWDSEGLSPFFLGDPDILRLGLNNMIMNALNHAYNEEVGPIRIRLRAGIPEALTIIVEDEGRGIPQGEQKKICTPFYRGRHSRQNQEKGSGLGLFITARKAAAAGGSLKLESPYKKIDATKQKGCRFTLKLHGTMLNEDEN